MSRLVSIILTLGFILQTGSKVIILLNYQANKDQIILQFCENKSKPAMKCNGKCHLKKQIKEDDKREDNEKNTLNTSAEISPFVRCSGQSLSFPPSQAADPVFLYLFSKTDSEKRAIFHPPSFALNNPGFIA